MTDPFVLWPIRTTPIPPLTDPAEPPPRGWCKGCGQEVYRTGHRFCRSCFAHLRKEYPHEQPNPKPLLSLHPCSPAQKL